MTTYFTLKRLAQRPSFPLKSLVGSIALLTFVTACSTTPTTNSPANLKASVYQGQKNLLSRQSYAYDFNFNLVRPNVPLNANPQRQQLIDQIASQNQLNPTQKALFEQGLVNDYSRSEQRSKIFDKYIERLYIAGKGVNDLGSGQFSVVPQAGYQATNAMGYIRMPLAVDLRQSKAYVDMSALSIAVTDPQYDGRYVVFDYQDWLKKSNFDVKPLLGFMKELMLLEPSIAKDSDYQALPLTQADKQKGASQRIRYQGDYDETIAKTALFARINEGYLNTLKINDDDEANKTEDELEGKMLANAIIDSATSREMSMYSSMGIAKSLLDKAFDSDKDKEEAKTLTLRQLENNAESASYRLANSFGSSGNDAYDSACGCGTEGSEETTDEAEAMATATVTEVTASVATVDSDYETQDSENSESDDLDEQRQKAFAKAVEQFAQFKTDKLITAQQFNQILTTHPQLYNDFITAYKNLYAPKQPTGTIVSDYLLNKQGQILSVEVLTPMASNDSSEYRRVLISDKENTKIRGVMNFYDYGKAKVDTNIAKNAVTFDQATAQNSAVAISRQSDKQSEIAEKAETQLARNLLASQDYVGAYTQLYQYKFIQNFSQSELQGRQFDDKDFDIAKLKQTAYELALLSAKDNNESMTAKQQADSENVSFDEDSDYIYYYAKQGTETLLQDEKTKRDTAVALRQVQAKGGTQAEQFARLYQYFAEQNLTNNSDSAVAADTDTSVTITASTVVIDDEYSPYEEACDTLKDNDTLDAKSRKNLNKICDKIATQTAEQVAEQVTATADDAPVESQASQNAQTLANEADYQAFIKTLGEIATSEINAKTAELDDESPSPIDTAWLEKLNQYNAYEDVFDRNAYQKAYTELLKQRFNVKE